ncbi:MAG: hypothetical protein QNJ13_13730 [Paracoccaceae bacterium]|nr:hypothetical protein [Paracoccaceae bacterium]
MIRRFLVAATLLIAACAPTDDLQGPPPDLGAFRLGHTVVLADDVTYGPFSRTIEEERIVASMSDAVTQRLGPPRYDGDGLYHLGILVGGLVLALPGVPTVYIPNSAMIIEVNVFDNATRQKLNDEPKQILVQEGLRNAVPFVGSGLVRGKDAQFENLSFQAAAAIQIWLLENAEWFAPKPGQERVAFPAPAAGPDAN